MQILFDDGEVKTIAYLVRYARELAESKPGSDRFVKAQRCFRDWLKLAHPYLLKLFDAHAGEPFEDG